jgi:hypothetical protein
MSDISIPNYEFPATNRPPPIRHSQFVIPHSKKQPFSSAIDHAMSKKARGTRREAANSSRRAPGGKSKIVRLPSKPANHPVRSQDAPSARESRDGADGGDGNVLAGIRDQESGIRNQENADACPLTPDSWPSHPLTPDNIVLFPTPAVIIPFPLEEAIGAEAKVRNQEKADACPLTPDSCAEEGSPLLPFPLSPPLDSRETQLPGEVSESEVSARAEARGARREARGDDGVIDTKVAGSGLGDGASGLLSSASLLSAETAGTSGARQEGRMESLKNSDRDGAGRVVPSSERGTRNAEPGTILDLSVGSVSATDWQAGRPVGGADRPASELSGARAADAAATVERISGLVMREVALVRQHSSDSMAVVLRPDAETELLVHFTRRDGQIEAFVRCERGDAHQLGALWPQLQETLAHQKVRLAPLQDAASNHASFNHASGSGRNGGGHGADRQPPPDKQSLDEWPAPASQGAAHVRGRGGSRHRRVTTSRPGWETWA